MSTRHQSVIHLLAIPLRVIAAVLASSLLFAVGVEHARAATISAAYTAGYRDVTINGYRADGLGMFVLDTGATVERAWCIEADVPHSTSADAYAAVPSKVAAPELDTLVWMLARIDHVDDDTAAAAAALTWYYAGARRSFGPPVWSDGARGFAPITPLEPQPWEALAKLTMAHPIGLRSGGVDLDAAERRVAELHRRATAHRGPWELAAGATPGEFTVRGAGGPITGVDIRITLHTTGSNPMVAELRTGPDGSARIAVPAMPDGGRVTARVEAPGPHREWDGGGATQRMATATTVVLTASTEVAPSPRYIEVRKSSADPTLSPEGAEFELRDGSHRVADRGRTGADGRLTFAAIDPTQHGAPYRIVETTPPTGLVAAEPVTIVDASTDPAAPTVVPIVNQPALVEIVIRKRLSLPGHGPADRSGFAFGIVRTDGLVRRPVTSRDGTTPPIGLPFGEYEICEQQRPEWAAGLVDTGCRSISIGTAELARGTIIEVEYVNAVPTPTIDTTAFDVADGDQVLPASGGTAIDRVRLEGLVPGTSYVLIGELVRADGGSTGVSSQLSIEAASASLEVELRFDVPAMPAGDYVIVEQLLLDTADVTVVAVHDDLADRDQTLTVLAPTTITTTTTDPTTPTTTTVLPTTPTTTTVLPTTTTTTTTVLPTTTATATSLPTTGVSVPATLPRTGVDDTVRNVLRLGDLVFVAGIGLTALAGFAPRRERRGHR